MGCTKKDEAPGAHSPEVPPLPTANLPLIVYATIPASRLQAVFDAYTAETGKQIQLVSGDRNISSSQADGQSSLPAADLLIMQSLSEMWPVAEQDGFRPIFSDAIEANIPRALRDSESRWTALGTHGRVVVYNTKLVGSDALDSVNDYSALGEKQWRGKLCLSSSKLPGNRTLVAFLIRRFNLREAESIVRNWRENLATNIFGDDLSLIEAVADGQCAMGIVDTSTLAGYSSADSAAPIAPHRFRDAESMVVDASGGGVMRHAHNPKDATDLLVWLTTNAPNALYAAQNHEFPANDTAALSRSIESWGDFVSAPAPLSALGFLYEDAVLLADRAGYL
jgi:iron(III) transport system substrate-binding protein